MFLKMVSLFVFNAGKDLPGPEIIRYFSRNYKVLFKNVNPSFTCNLLGVK